MSEVRSLWEAGSHLDDQRIGSRHLLFNHLSGISRASEAIAAAELDWQVVKEPLPPEARRLTARSALTHALMRTGPNGSPGRTTLGLVTDGYTPFQNQEAFAFFEPVVQAGIAELDTAGALDHGRIVVVVARMLNRVAIKGRDYLERYLLFVNNHSGASPQVQLLISPLRVSCSNMLPVISRLEQNVLAGSDGDLRAQLRHAEERLRSSDQQYSNMELNFRRMANMPMTRQRVARYVKEVFSEPARNVTQKERPQVLRHQQLAERLFESGRGNNEPGIRGTLWAAYNGVTELVDHHTQDESAGARLHRIWLGKGYEIKLRAYQVALRWLERPIRDDCWHFTVDRGELDTMTPAVMTRVPDLQPLLACR